MRMPPGFTLVETLVALVLFAFGMLALAGTAAVAARDLSSARLREQAHALARNGVERLASRGCSSTGSAVTISGRFVEHRRVESSGARLRISDSVVYRRPDGRNAHVVARAAILCAP